jgi:chitinase
VPSQQSEPVATELALALDEELTRLPERYRSALVLCCLEGKSGEEAARQLGRPVGTIWYQLSRGRELLRGRLASRGIAVSIPALVAFLAGQASAASIPTTLAGSTLQGAVLVAASKSAAELGVSASVQTLLHGMLQSMLFTKLKIGAAFLAAILAVTGTVSVVAFREAPQSTPPNPAGEKRIVAYFAEWSVYDRNFHVANVPADKLTHVNYAFAKISDAGECTLFDKYAAVEKTYPGDKEDGSQHGNFRQLQLLKEKHPHLKTLLSVGGWTLSGPFSDAARTAESRAKLAKSCVQVMTRYGFDGLDIDWEYPVSGGLESNKTRPEDKQNYTLLLTELRKQLDAQGETDRKRYLLTIAAPAGPANIANFELDKLAPLLDWFNLMAYDFHGGWSARTNFAAPLYVASADPAPDGTPERKYSVDHAVKAYIAAGVPRTKIVVGMPFYARGWGGVGKANNGLYQAHARELPKGTWEQGVWDYKDLSANYIGKFKRYWNDEAKAPWLYDADKGVMITYDDPESLRIKAEYVRAEGLGGAMIWELSGDDRGSSLLKAIRDGLELK